MQCLPVRMRECLCSAAVQTIDAFTARSVVFQITLSGVSGSANLIIVHVLCKVPVPPTSA